MSRAAFVIATALGLALMPVRAAQPRASSTGNASADIVLLPTPHPRVPANLAELWFVPDAAARPALTPLTVAMRQVVNGEYSKALPVLSRSSSHEGTLGGYAMYEFAIANLRLGNAEEARKTFKALREKPPSGLLGEAAAIGEAECDEALLRWPSAMATYERLLKGKPFAPDDLLLRLGRAAKAGGRPEKAVQAFLRAYYEFALTPSAADAAFELTQFTLPPIEAGSERYQLEMGRAVRLFGAKQYTPAKSAFELLRPLARGDDRELVDLRIAESNYFLKERRDAREGLLPFTREAARQAEALFFYALTTRELGDTTEYIATVRRLSKEFPDSTWTAEALNNLATYYIVQDDDEQADVTFRELLAALPKGPYADRAAWKVGWAAYRQQHYDETIAFFERAAADFPRSDYRPAWLYWAGRAREAQGDLPTARARYTLVVADYLNSYYGRLALKRPGVQKPPSALVADQGVTYNDAEAPGRIPPPVTAPLIRALGAAGLYDEALSELRYAQRTSGDSPAIQATMAWISYQKGLNESGNERFTLLRGAINTMRRAYPQFLAAGGEQLPREILSIIFPVAYWDQIRQQSTARGLDPYLMAALMAQESTFVADVRSRVNAVGLMQLMAPTARQQARKLGIRYSASLLTNPEANIRMGMSYFAQTVKEFGAVHLALASYNAGESPVRRWIAERPNLPQDEFIDDIPYPETQTYVKRILGTAEDYRRLYR